jgi:hypothetical protein
MEFVPPNPALILVSAFAIARFENQRWIKARVSGLQGKSAATGLFIDYTGIVALVFSFVFVVSFGFQFGWKAAIGILVLGLIASIIWALISTLITATMFGTKDSVFFWIIGTLAIWPIMFLLAQETNWFGLLG